MGAERTVWGTRPITRYFPANDEKSVMLWQKMIGVAANEATDKGCSLPAPSVVPTEMLPMKVRINIAI